MSQLRNIRPVVLIAALCCAVLPARGAQTTTVTAETEADMLAGQTAGVAITSDGSLMLAPALKNLLSAEASYVWSLVPDGRGGAYAATGSEGNLYHVAADSGGTVVAKTFEYELFALTAGREGVLYFSGAPNGTITSWDPRTDKTETVIDLPEGLVWDLLLAPDGSLYAGTGDTGQIYRITPGGETKAIGRVPDAHAVRLAWYDNTLVCGTDNRGLLVAVDPQGGGYSVLYDTGREEISALLPLADGSLLFAANGGGNSEGAQQGAGGGAATADGTTLVLPGLEVRAAGPGGAALFQRLPSGLVRQVWACPEHEILDLALAPDGSVLAATGDEGILYSLDSLWNETRLIDFKESQLLSLARDGQRVFIGTGNSGSVYRLDWSAPRAGVYISDVIEADQTVEWGEPDWVMEGHGNAVFETRSGQIEAPEESWSAWQPLADGRIASPPARYIQWRARLSGPPDGRLRFREVSIPYRGPNRAPLIERLDVSLMAPKLSTGAQNSGPIRQTLPSGVEVEYGLGEAPESGEIERTGIWARSLRSAVWDAADPDGDPLRFDLYLRPLDSERFIRLAHDIEDRAYTWDATAWPDGWYELRVSVTDERGNPADEALTDQRVSSPFRVDNTAPSLTDLGIESTSEGAFVVGAASDAGRLAYIEISADGEVWKSVRPLDGIVDGASEQFRVPVPMRKDGKRPALVGVRASDQVGNVTTQRIMLPAE